MKSVKELFSEAFWDRFSKEVQGKVQNANLDCQGFICEECRACSTDSETGDMLEVVSCFECQCKHRGCEGCLLYGTEQCEYK